MYSPKANCFEKTSLTKFKIYDRNLFVTVEILELRHGKFLIILWNYEIAVFLRNISVKEIRIRELRKWREKNAIFNKGFYIMWWMGHLGCCSKKRTEKHLSFSLLKFSGDYIFVKYWFESVLLKKTDSVNCPKYKFFHFSIKIGSKMLVWKKNFEFLLKTISEIPTWTFFQLLVLNSNLQNHLFK